MLPCTNLLESYLTLFFCLIRPPLLLPCTIQSMLAHSRLSLISLLFRRLVSPPPVINNSHCTKTGISLLVSFSSSALPSLLESSTSTLLSLSCSPHSIPFLSHPKSLFLLLSSRRRTAASLFPFDDEGIRDHAVELVTYRVLHPLVTEDRSPQ